MYREIVGSANTTLPNHNGALRYRIWYSLPRISSACVDGRTIMFDATSAIPKKLSHVWLRTLRRPLRIIQPAWVGNTLKHAMSNACSQVGATPTLLLHIFSLVPCGARRSCGCSGMSCCVPVRHNYVAPRYDDDDVGLLTASGLETSESVNTRCRIRPTCAWQRNLTRVSKTTAKLARFHMRPRIPCSYAMAPMDRRCAIAAVTYDARLLGRLIPRHLDDKGVVLCAARAGSTSLGVISARLRADDEVAMAFIENCGRLLKHASTEIQDNEDIAFTAVLSSGHALKYTSARIQNMDSMVETAVITCGDAVKFASTRLLDDGKFMERLIRYDASIFEHASARLRNTPDFAWNAVLRCTVNVQFVSVRLMNTERFSMYRINK